MVEHITCPLCGGDSSAPHLQLRDHQGGETFAAVRCGECGYGYLDPAPPPDCLEHYYTNVSGESMRRPPGGLFRKMQRVAFARETRPLRDRLSLGDPIVDLGAGDGALVRYLQHEGFNAGAADFYPEAEWRLPEIPFRSLDLHGGSLDGDEIRSILGIAPKAATIRHVLEHLHRPRQVLEAVADSGTEWVYIVVPNCDSVFARHFGESWYYWDPPRHLQFFDLRTLGEMCERSGFRVEASGHYGIDEIVTSVHRAVMLRNGMPGRQMLETLTRPKGALAAASSAFASTWARTVCWCLARRLS